MEIRATDKIFFARLLRVLIIIANIIVALAIILQTESLKYYSGSENSSFYSFAAFINYNNYLVIYRYFFAGILLFSSLMIFLFPDGLKKPSQACFGLMPVI